MAPKLAEFQTRIIQNRPLFARIRAVHDGEYAVTNTRSSVDPFLTYSTERSLREQVWRIFVNRGDNGDEHDNNALIAAILKLRYERVRLLGFADYATWCLEDRMAKTPARAMELMEAVWPAALARVQEEVADMQAIADAEGAGITIESLGLPLLRRKGPSRPLRPRLRRGHAVPAARPPTRGPESAPAPGPPPTITTTS